MAMINTGKDVNISLLTQTHGNDQASNVPKTRKDVMALGNESGGVLEQMGGGKLGVREGDARDAPTGAKSGFLGKLKAGLQAFRAMIGNILDRIFNLSGARANARETPQLQSGGPRFIEMAKEARAELLIKASKSDDIQVATHALTELGKQWLHLDRQNAAAPEHTRRSDQMVMLTLLNNMRTSALRPIDDTVLEHFKSHGDALAQTLSGNESGLKVLEFLRSYDQSVFETCALESLDKQTRFLDDAATNMESFTKGLKNAFRGNTLFSAASVEKCRSSENREALSNALREIIDEKEAPNKQAIQSSLVENKGFFLNRLDEQMSGIVVDMTQAFLDLATREGGPGSARAIVGQEGLAWLSTVAQRIMDHPTAPLEAKQALVVKIVSDQVMLRGFTNTIAMLKPDSKELANCAATLLLRAINDLPSAGKDIPKTITDAYPHVRQAAQEHIRSIIDMVMEGVTMPETERISQISPNEGVSLDIEQLQKENMQSWDALETEILEFQNEVKRRNSENDK